MMTREARQEALSLAYVHAVAAACGMTYSTRSRDLGIDLALHEVAERAGRLSETGTHLDIQLKSTTRAVVTRTEVGYDLAARAYDVLRFEADPARVLLLLDLPADEARWLRPGRAGLALAGPMYWLSLRGRPAVRNRSSVRVTIPRRQVFTPTSLRWIMDRIRAGEGVP